MNNCRGFFDGILSERQIRTDELMSAHTTYGIGGPADVFVTPVNETELTAILKKAYSEHVPVTVIGGGSNCLVRDKGIRGIVICTMRMVSSIRRD